jgi:8-oxo-dGTP pyrophosphatase MutT (NUDIX family)
MIDSGETPRQAGLRELLEETGQRPDVPLRFVGYPRFVLGPARRVEYAALFTGHTTTPRTFRASDEIEAAHWWDQARPLPGAAQSLDVHLARLARSSPRHR